MASTRIMQDLTVRWRVGGAPRFSHVSKFSAALEQRQFASPGACAGARCSAWVLGSLCACCACPPSSSAAAAAQERLLWMTALEQRAAPFRPAAAADVGQRHPVRAEAAAAAHAARARQAEPALCGSTVSARAAARVRGRRSTGAPTRCGAGRLAPGRERALRAALHSMQPVQAATRRRRLVGGLWTWGPARPPPAVALDDVSHRARCDVCSAFRPMQMGAAARPGTRHGAGEHVAAQCVLSAKGVQSNTFRFDPVGRCSVRQSRLQRNSTTASATQYAGAQAFQSYGKVP